MGEQQRMATKYKEISGQPKMPAFQRSTCWQPGMTGCDVHCGVLTLWSVGAGSKSISFGQICFSSLPVKEESLKAGGITNIFNGFKIGQYKL